MGGGKGSNTTKSTFKLPPEFIKAYNESLQMARNAVNQPYTPYTGQLVAGLTPGQQQGIANIQASQGMALPFIQEGAGYTREAARGITPELYQRFYSPYVRDVAEATQANLLESAAQQRSGLKSGAIGAGAFGGDRAGIAQAEMARQQNLANAQAMANIYNQGYGQAMGLAGQQVQNLGAMGQQLAGLGTGAQTSALQGAQAQMAAGAQEQATNQAQLQAAYDQFLQQQSYPFQLAQFFANIAQGLGSTAGGTSTTKAPSPSIGSQILGGLGAIANIAGAIPSDKRAKENIQEVGRLNDGQTIYRYNFKGDPKTQIGLLAQEVEEVNPDAVTAAGGLKMVNYKDATEDAASMGGVVAPDGDRQNFMNGGIPYGGSGFIPQNPMMTAAANKIPGAATPSADLGLAGAADMTKPFTDQQKQGVANIASLFQKPSLYKSGGVVGRHGYATDGGVPFMPYSGSRGWVPEGKMGGGGDRIGERAPKAFEDKGLAEDWEKIVPVSSEQAAGLVDAFGRAKKALGFGPDANMAAAGYMTPPSTYEVYDPVEILADKYGPLKERFASGGVAGRNGYQFGGEPTMEDAMREAEEQGLAAVPAPDSPRYPRLIQSESGGNFKARNKQGYVGRAQFGEARLAEAKRAGVIPAEATAEDFRLNPDMQKAAESWHFNDINNFIDSTGLAAMEGKSINGVPITREGMVNVAHLGGKGGLQKFITSGGRYNPADANGTRLSDYFAMGAGGGGESVQPISADVSGLGGTPQPMSAEVEAAPERLKSGFSLKNLFASETNPSIVEQIIGRRLSPEARSAMLNASFALMAGKSPFFFTNVGEAGKVGTQTYYNALANKREMEKMRSDVARQTFEAETGRMTAETAQLNAARQLYSQMLPQIRFWQMRNPGKPLPPEFQRVIDAAYPPQGPAGLVQAPGQAPSLAGAAPALPAPEGGVTVPQAPEMPPAAGVPAGAPAGVGEAAPIPPSAGEAATSGATELDALYEQLPDELNPNYWTRMAENAMTVEDYSRASERAAELTKQYQESGIPLPSGIVPFPGTIERQQQEKLAGLQTEGAYKATSEQTERAQTTIGAYQQSKNTLDQAAEKLARIKTGQLEETKTYLVTALNSLGLVDDADLLKQATGVQELRKVFSQILFSGGLKDKIGSQIAARELEMFAAGFGDVNLEPAVNRFIVGTMRGILDMEAQRARDWIAFARKPENRGKTFSRSEIVDWEINWNDENPIADFVGQSVANTPVMGEVNWSAPVDEIESKLKPGYKYVIPKGNYPIGSIDADMIVEWDGETLNEVE